MSATPTMIAAAWRAFRGERKGPLLGPGPGFVEAINAALAADDRAPARPEDDIDRRASEIGDEVGRRRAAFRDADRGPAGRFKP